MKDYRMSPHYPSIPGIPLAPLRFAKGGFAQLQVSPVHTGEMSAGQRGRNETTPLPSLLDSSVRGNDVVMHNSLSGRLLRITLTS